jgi:hypothetical protein
VRAEIKCGETSGTVPERKTLAVQGPQNPTLQN